MTGGDWEIWRATEIRATSREVGHAHHEIAARALGLGVVEAISKEVIGHVVAVKTATTMIKTTAKAAAAAALGTVSTAATALSGAARPGEDVEVASADRTAGLPTRAAQAATTDGGAGSIISHLASEIPLSHTKPISKPWASKICP